MHFLEMLPRLGARYPLEIETTQQPRAAFRSESWRTRGLPAAPAIMIDGQVIVEGKDIGERDLEAAIRSRLAAS